MSWDHVPKRRGGSSPPFLIQRCNYSQVVLEAVMFSVEYRSGLILD
jgi:hypothetical protein